MLIKTSDINLIKPFTKTLVLPRSNSHKGQNGRVLIVGGSSLFHSASIWAAEIASYFVDMVHYSSTVENNEIFLGLKKKFRNGIVVEQKDLDEYVKEDDVILVGPGMVRLGKEGEYTSKLAKYLIEKFPDKKFVFDGGTLQMMDASWLLNLKTKPILTPHQKEFSKLFGEEVLDLPLEKKAEIVKAKAKKYHCIILLKAIVDIISDGEKNYLIEGGNAGLTKGGTGDLLAGITTALFSKNKPLLSAVIASFFLKKTADELFLKKGFWYNIDDLIGHLPVVFKKNILV